MTDVQLSGYKPHTVYRNQNTRDAWIISELDNQRLVLWKLEYWGGSGSAYYYNIERTDQKYWTYNCQTKKEMEMPCYKSVTVDRLPLYWKRHLKEQGISLTDHNQPGYMKFIKELEDAS